MDEEMNGDPNPTPPPARTNQNRNQGSRQTGERKESKPSFIDISTLQGPDALRALAPTLTNRAAILIWNHRNEVEYLGQLTSLEKELTDKDIKALTDSKIVAIPKSTENPLTPPAAPKVETSKKEEEKKGFWRKAANVMKIITTPISPLGKGKVGYVLGLILGGSRYIFTVATPFGIPYSIGTDIAMAGLATGFQLWRRWRINKEKDPIEKAKTEAGLQAGLRGNIAGFCAGYAATSVAKAMTIGVANALPEVGKGLVSVSDWLGHAGEGLKGLAGYDQARLAHDTMTGITGTHEAASYVAGNPPPGILQDIKNIGINTYSNAQEMLFSAGEHITLTPDQMRDAVSWNYETLQQLAPDQLKFWESIAGTPTNPIVAVDFETGAPLIEGMQKAFDNLFEFGSKVDPTAQFHLMGHN